MPCDNSDRYMINEKILSLTLKQTGQLEDVHEQVNGI